MPEHPYFDIALNEYNALRTEINNAMANQQSILNYGIASIGIILAFSTSNWQEMIIVDIILVFLIPLIGLLVATIWLGEVNRIARAGQFLVVKENRINDLFLKMEENDTIFQNQPVLIWENYLRDLKKNGSDKSIKTIWNYRAILLLLGILSTTSIAIGIYHNYVITSHQFIGVFLFVGIFFLLSNVFTFMILNRIKKGYTYVSVDGGGTKTRVLISKNGTEREIHLIEQGLNHKKEVNYLSTMKQVFQYVDREVGIRNVDRFIFGISGLDTEHDRRILNHAIRVYIRRRYTLVNDIQLLKGFMKGKDRKYIIAIAGTGSNVLSSNYGIVKTNKSFGVYTQGGIRHIMDFLIQNASGVDRLPANLRDFVKKYNGVEYDIDELGVIEDFKEHSLDVFKHLDNEDCKNAVIYGIDHLIMGIRRHTLRFHRYVNLYLYGGQFHTKGYQKLFMSRLESSGLNLLRVTILDGEPVKAGMKLI
ncbi:MAG: hypothetical protein PHP32_06010 [Candidatus Izemoplasmatales bacterium]|nr:hypothetical protein [Candidatus Izemoplasmatales bacterium]